MILSQINWLSLFLGALAGFVLGALWYGPLFSKAWMKAAGITKEDGKGINVGVLMSKSFVTYLILAFVISVLLILSPAAEAGNHTWHEGAHIGLLVGLASLTTVFNNSFYEMRPTSLGLINGVYALLNGAVIGAVIGAF
jgi:hypothetical protein